MAEALLRRRAEELDLDLSVSSVGSLFDGRPAEDGALGAMKALGIDLTAHQARSLTPTIVGCADLVLGMEQAHVREVSVVPGGSFERTFTLPDLVARAERVAPRRPGETPADWLARVGEGRSPADAMAAARHLEVADPMGMSKRHFRRCAAELSDLIDRLVAVAWPPTSAPSAPPDHAVLSDPTTPRSP
jgi:protein-tyrosine-phosphatase